jgi:hypothetical protein
MLFNGSRTPPAIGERTYFYFGIYDLDGDTLKVCFNMDHDPRPKEFKSARKSRFLLLTLKRAK